MIKLVSHYTGEKKKPQNIERVKCQGRANLWWAAAKNEPPGGSWGGLPWWSGCCLGVKASCSGGRWWLWHFGDPDCRRRGLLLRGGCRCRWLLQDGAVNWSSDHYLQGRHLPSGHLSTGQALSPSSQDGLDPLRP